MTRDSNLLLRVLLPFELTNGNDGRRKSWYKPAKFRQNCEAVLRLSGLGREPFEEPVVVHVTRLLGRGQHLWDSSSIGRGNWKEIEDALVAVGWFHDDGPQWIKETRFFQDASRRGECPRVLVEVFDCE